MVTNNEVVRIGKRILATMRNAYKITVPLTILGAFAAATTCCNDNVDKERNGDSGREKTAKLGKRVEIEIDEEGEFRYRKKGEFSTGGELEIVLLNKSGKPVKLPVLEEGRSYKIKLNEREILTDCCPPSWIFSSNTGEIAIEAGREHIKRHMLMKERIIKGPKGTCMKKTLKSGNYKMQLEIYGKVMETIGLEYRAEGSDAKQGTGVGRSIFYTEKVECPDAGYMRIDHFP